MKWKAKTITYNIFEFANISVTLLYIYDTSFSTIYCNQFFAEHTDTQTDYIILKI